jgi:hypothetical protein
MERLIEIKELLEKVQRNLSSSRTEDVRMLQDKIWAEHNLEKQKEQEFLSDLAYNLNFYDPQETDPALGYYDDKRLSEIVGEAIKKIQMFIQ